MYGLSNGLVLEGVPKLCWGGRSLDIDVMSSLTILCSESLMVLETGKWLAVAEVK